MPVLLDIRRNKRNYQLREAIIKSNTSYNCLQAFNTNPNGNGRHHMLKPMWRKKVDDLISTVKRTSPQLLSARCSHLNYPIDQKIHRFSLNIFEVEETLYKNGLITKIAESDQRLTSQNSSNKKLSHHARDLKKVHQV